MLVTFSCQAYANVTFFGEVGKELLKMMGCQSGASGSIPAIEVRAALERLHSQVEAGKGSSSSATPAKQNPDTDFNDETISLATRAVPLLELLRVAAEEKCNVWWEIK